MVELNKTESTAISLIKNSMYSTIDEISFDQVDFEDLFNFADKQSVNMITFDAITNPKDTLPAHVYNKWIYFASRKMANFEELLSVHKKLTFALEKNNIDYVVFKGLCAGIFYPKSILREYGDIDVFVSKDMFKAAHEVLISEEFILVSRNDKHLHYKFGNIDVELHFDFWSTPNNSCGRYIKELLFNSVAARKLYTFDGYSFFGPDVITHALILVLHIVNHLQSGGVGLRHLCDLVAFVNSNDFNENYHEIINVYKKGGLYKTALVLLNICHDYFSSPKFYCLNEVEKEVSDALLLDFVKGGNFGRLSEESYYGSSFFTMEKSNDSNIFKSIFSFCMVAWPICKKHKILLPIAPVVIGVRYLFRMILGLRPKINPIKYTLKGLKRSELYKKLKFFEER